MKYKDRISGVKRTALPSADLSIIAAMFLLVVMAWGVAKMEKSMISVGRVIPEFTIANQLDVIPVIEPTLKKDAVKVGKFMSLAKTSAIQGNAVENVNAQVLKNIVPVKNYPSAKTLSAPRIIYKTIPDYPTKAVENAQQGVVMVKVYILKNGRVGNAAVEQSSGFEMLDKSALAAVSQWIFEPASYSSEVTESWFRVPVKFQLKS